MKDNDSGDSMDCDDHHSKFKGHKHPDANHKPSFMADHERGAAHPQHHTKGQLRSQMNPDHGPHKGAGRHV